MPSLYNSFIAPQQVLKKKMPGGQELIFRPMGRGDVQGLQTWDTHSDPRLWHYQNFCHTVGACHYWYYYKQRVFSRRVYGLFSGETGELFGYITLKNIDWLQGKGEMGIVINPGCLEKGYGTAGLKLYRQYVFDHLGFREITLKVAEFNARAQHVYEKLGFRRIKRLAAPYEEQEKAIAILNLKDPSFWMQENTLYTHFWLMSQTREQWRQSEASILKAMPEYEGL